MPAKSRSRTKSRPNPRSPKPPPQLPWYRHSENLIIALLTLVATVITAITFLAKPAPFLADLTSSTAAEAVVPAPTPTLFPQAVNPAPEPYVSAKAVYIWEPKTDTVLLAKNPHLRLPPASITKIMTAIIALEQYFPTQVVTVKDADRSVGQTANLLPGETLTVTDLIQALLINSGNDAAVALAQNHPQGYAYFLELMNQKAADLGLTNTNFANVSGVQAQNHYSTVADLVKLGAYALNLNMIKNTVQTKTASITDTTGQTTHPLYNTNLLLHQDPTVKGIKTGWTTEAGECLLTYVDRDGFPLIIAVLGSADRFGDTRQLIDWAYTNFALL